MADSPKEGFCDLHGRKLVLTRVRIVYGLVRGTPKASPGYLAARRKGFPHTDDVAFGGCVVKERRQCERMVCLDCVAARNQWLAENFPSWAAKNELSGL